MLASASLSPHNVRDLDRRQAGEINSCEKVVCTNLEDFQRTGLDAICLSCGNLGGPFVDDAHVHASLGQAVGTHQAGRTCVDEYNAE
jgi:hypothetical protein